MPPATTPRLRAPTVTVRPLRRTICKKLEISVESFQALCRTLGPILSFLISGYERYSNITQADQDTIRDMVLAHIWQNKTIILQKQDARDYVFGVIVDKVFAFYREMGQEDKLHEITLQMRAERLIRS